MTMTVEILQSVDRVKILIREAREAQRQLAALSQAEIDDIVERMARAAEVHAKPLAVLAHRETGYGRWEDKVARNLHAARTVSRSIRGLRTIGVVNGDGRNGTEEIAVPVGVVAALVSATDPTASVFARAMLAVKTGNAVIFSPHPLAAFSTAEAVRALREAAEAAGAPKGVVACIETPTKKAVQELMSSEDTALILAAGDDAEVSAAYRSGTPAIGTAPGNCPVFVEASADLEDAFRLIFDSRAFDNGLVPSTEQAIIVEERIRRVAVREIRRNGGFVLSPVASEKLAWTMMRGDGSFNPQLIGRDARYIAELAGIEIPAGTRVLVSEQTSVARDNPYARVKPAPILALHVEPDPAHALARCLELLSHDGRGASAIIHSRDDAVIRSFACALPVRRLLVNEQGAAELAPPDAAERLRDCWHPTPAHGPGCGASDLIGPMHLMNLRRIASGAAS